MRFKIQFTISRRHALGARGDGAGAAASSDAISHAFFFASALAMLFW